MGVIGVEGVAAQHAANTAHELGERTRGREWSGLVESGNKNFENLSLH